MSEIDPEDTKEYSCPANPSHKLIGQTEFHKHIFRCKDVEGKRLFQCKFNWTHMFRFEEERNHHEYVCEQKRPDVPRYKDFIYINPKKEYTEKDQMKQQNMLDSAHYYFRNKEKLEYEKELKRRIREKREQEEAERREKEARNQARVFEFTKYTKDYILENSTYITTNWFPLFLVQVTSGERKLEKKSFEMKGTFELEDKLLEISNLEYKKILGGEFIAHPDYCHQFDQIKTKINTQATIACLDYCQLNDNNANDELIVLTTSKYVPHLPEDHLALLILRHSKFINGERPYHIPETNVSKAFINDYSQYLPDNQKDLEENAENSTAMITLEYKEQVKKKGHQVIEVLLQKTSFENNNPLKREYESLQNLLKEKEELKQHEAKLGDREAQLKNQLDEYKRKLTQNFINTVHAKQEELNVQINRFYTDKRKELETLDQDILKLEEEESELMRTLNDERAEIDVSNKKRKKLEAQVHQLEQSIGEKKKTIEISKNLALTNVLDSLCHVCQQNRINILYLSCYHFYVCEECQKKASEVGRHECLYCHQPIEKIIKVIV